jgi:hypothetical protein
MASPARITGSGKTGLLMVLVEEPLRSSIPVLMIDVKGDLPSLLLTFPNLAAEEFAPWVDGAATKRSGQTRQQVAAALAEGWRNKLADWQLGPADVAQLRSVVAPRLITPGTTAGEPLHVLSSIEQPSRLWHTDLEAARESLGASISLLLRLIGRDPDPVRSRDHVSLSVFAERRLRQGMPADVASLLGDVRTPPIAEIGAMGMDDFLPRKEHNALATALNTLLASPTFESWRQGCALDIGEWLTPGPDGRNPAVIVSVAHLDDDDRTMVLGVIFEQLLAWVRTLQGTSELRALVAMDEVYGFAPPHPANPQTKRPLVSLVRQARAFGVGMLLATQNPMDLDYRALSNAGMRWFVVRNMHRAGISRDFWNRSSFATKGRSPAHFPKLGAVCGASPSAPCDGSLGFGFPSPRQRRTTAAEHEGWSVHAGVTVDVVGCAPSQQPEPQPASERRSRGCVHDIDALACPKCGGHRNDF